LCFIFTYRFGELEKAVCIFLSLGAAVFLAGFLHLTSVQTYPANHITKFVSDTPQKVYIRGKVASNPEVSRTFYHSKKMPSPPHPYPLPDVESVHCKLSLNSNKNYTKLSSSTLSRPGPPF